MCSSLILSLCFLFQLSSLPDLIPALTAAEQRAAASLKWRTHEKLLQKYACLPHVISSDQIYYRFLQRMFTIMMTNVSPDPLILFSGPHTSVWSYTNSFAFLNSCNKLSSLHSAQKGVSFPGPQKGTPVSLCFPLVFPLTVLYPAGGTNELVVPALTRVCVPPGRGSADSPRTWHSSSLVGEAHQSSRSPPLSVPSAPTLTFTCVAPGPASTVPLRQGLPWSL